ncbi:MAG: WbqC family protein [Cytophagales bacterium]|nr:WbqC family protein [Cytophagales bacterium]
MNHLLIELHYLPSVEYFKQIIQHDELHIEACENFQKQTYRSRCKILTSNGVNTLSIPVNAKGRFIQDVTIDYSQRWLNDHWRAIVSAYNNSPYFEHYEMYFHDVFFRKPSHLFELNVELLSLSLKLLGFDKKVVLTTDYQKEIVSSIADWRNKIHPKKLDSSRSYIPYTQVFESSEGFVENLSIVDLLFCEGNYAQEIIKSSI